MTTLRIKLYLDTSVLGAVCDPGPEERLLATRRVLNGLRDGIWDGYISVLVLEEISRAHETVRQKIAQQLEKSNLMVLEESSDSLALAQAYIEANAIPPDYEDDARHIAIATLHDINVIVSWNFRHMVNIERKRRINSVNLLEGRPLIDIVSPWEVSDEEA
jgi:predicted nucleic acid-binding protein